MTSKFILNQNEAPISVAMENYARDGALAFHTPGHKQGLGAHPLLKNLITEDGLRQEVSLMEELDDLHEPEGCIKKAQELAAELWGSKASFFMINGTTGAIHAMLMGTLRPNDEVLVPRNAHRSIIGGIILAGAVPVYVQPELDTRLGIPMGLSVQSIRTAIRLHPHARALVAVYPTYYGFACDLKSIAEIVHEAGMLLLVDEAHGAHLRFSEALPPQAIDCGADVAAQSTHKLLGSMTQTSMLQVGSERVDIARIQQAAGLLQSTSPNQLLLASLDIARLQMATEGEASMQRAVELAEQLRREINAIPGLFSPGSTYCQAGDTSGAAALDVTKVTVNLAGLTLSGMAAELKLRHEYKVQCELSDPYNLLFIISMADTEREVQVLVDALRDMASRYLRDDWTIGQTELATDSHEQRHDGAGRLNDHDRLSAHTLADAPAPIVRLNPREAFFATTEEMDFAASAGRISAETVTFYPPGVPVLCPGEEITAGIISYIRKYQAYGMRLSGPHDGLLAKIRIVKEESNVDDSRNSQPDERDGLDGKG